MYFIHREVPDDVGTQGRMKLGDFARLTGWSSRIGARASPVVHHVRPAAFPTPTLMVRHSWESCRLRCWSGTFYTQVSRSSLDAFSEGVVYIKCHLPGTL